MATFNVSPVPGNNGYMQMPQQMYNPYGNNIFNQPQNYDFLGKINNNSQQRPAQEQFLKCRPVSSKEEAVASQIDLDGSLWVFTDVGNGKIYTKQINNDGTATFKTYTFTEDENPYASTEFVTKNEFNKVIQSLLAAIQSPQKQDTSNSISTVKTDTQIENEKNLQQIPLNF